MLWYVGSGLLPEYQPEAGEGNPLGTLAAWVGVVVSREWKTSWARLQCRWMKTSRRGTNCLRGRAPEIELRGSPALTGVTPS